jgi:N-acetylglucosaminyl-diphospho-decaprenol L-rhamnosyltransferase
MEGRRPAVAVAVVSWNTRELLEKCLASLAHDATAGLAEVWVVDNASADASADAARRHSFARVVTPGRNLGYGPAINLVARATTTPWLACANADVALTPGALEQLLAAGAGAPTAGALAPRLLLPGGTTQHSVHAFPTLRTLAAYQSGVARIVPRVGERLAFAGLWDPQRERDVDWAVGAFQLIRREAWEAAGGFEERPDLYAEDLDLGWRLRRAGWVTRYVPSALVHHEESAATTRAWGDGRHERRQVATYAWLARRRGRRHAAAAAAINVAGSVARAPSDPKPRLAEALRHVRAARRALGAR